MSRNIHRTIEVDIELCDFNELSYDAKQRAIEEYSDILRKGNDWWEPFIEDTVEDIKKTFGFKNIKFEDIHFSLAYVQGDYFAFDVKKQVLTKQNIGKYLSDFYKTLRNNVISSLESLNEKEKDKLLTAFKNGIEVKHYLEICNNTRHSDYISIDVNDYDLFVSNVLDDFDTEDKLLSDKDIHYLFENVYNVLSETIIKPFEDDLVFYCRKRYSMLQDEWEYWTSEEALEEIADDRGWAFEADGSIVFNPDDM